MSRKIFKISMVALVVAICFTLFVSCGQSSNNIPSFFSDEIVESETTFSNFNENDQGAYNSEASNASVLDFNLGYLGYIEMGYYPQTVAERKAVAQMSKVTDSTGYYYSTYDNEHYEKVSTPKVASLNPNTYEFSTQDTIENGQTYYFKVEKIRWDIYGRINALGQTVNLFLVSHNILDSSEFQASYGLATSDDYEIKDQNGQFTGIKANTWEYSTLRQYLNETLYNKMFTEEEKALIVAQDTNIDNIKDNISICTTATATGLKMFPTAQVTDYARVRNTFMDTNKKYYGNGRYWLRDAGNNTYRVQYYGSNATISNVGESVGAEYIGVRPTIILNASSTIQILTDSDNK